MIHKIESDALVVTASEKGAELQSIKAKDDGMEYLWQGEAPFWPGRAPILFPIVGGLKGGSYRHDDVAYTMPNHGFARASNFRCVEATANCLVFELVASPQTKACYPFDFNLHVIYTLQAASLHVEYLVTNFDKQDMLFSIGGHEGYRCPREVGETFEDYYLEFYPGDHEFISSSLTTDGLLAGGGFAVDMPGGRLPLDYKPFRNIDTYIFEDIKSKRVALKSKKSPSYVEVAFDAPHLGIWTQTNPDDAPFLCIEPWHGLPDADGTDGLLAAKKDIVRLAAGDSRPFCHTISIKKEAAL